MVATAKYIVLLIKNIFKLQNNTMQWGS
jgi:hypothetical protein